MLYEPGRLSPEQTWQFFDNDYKNWAEVVRETGVQIKS